MKKLILMAAAAMMVLASCTKTTVESIDGPKEISFNKFEGAMTKASDHTGDLGAYAIVHETNDLYFTNIQFSKGDLYWIGNPKQYWPLTSKLDFVVYSPYDNTNVSYNPTSKILTIDNIDNSSTTTDWLYGDKLYNNDGTGFDKNTTYVPVVLKHAMAKVTFKVIANVDGVFTLTNLTLNDVNQAGKIDVSYAPSITVTPTLASPNVLVDKTFSDDQTIGTTETNIITDYIVFPSEQTSFNISYKMYELSETQNNIDITGNWEPGKHYIYTITLTANEIKFDADVDGWVDTVVPTNTVN